MKKLILLSTFFSLSICFGQRVIYDVDLCGVHHEDSSTINIVSGCDSLFIIDAKTGVPAAGFQVTGGEVIVAGVPGLGGIRSNGKFDAQATSLLGASAGHTVMITYKFRRPDGVVAMGQMKFFVLK